MSRGLEQISYCFMIFGLFDFLLPLLVTSPVDTYIQARDCHENNSVFESNNL